MERLLTSLHDLLDPELDSPPPRDAPTPFFPLSLKCSVLHNVACGLAYLHGRSPPVIHRDLSARNVLLNSGMVAKIADLGVARIVPRMRAAATMMTKGPGALVYMPPEAMEENTEDENVQDDEVTRAKYDASIDIFSFGVVAIFILCQTFPDKLLAPNYRSGSRLLARTELERRQRYMMVIYMQLREGHPLLHMIEGCLGFSEDRPSISQVLGLLEDAGAEERGELTQMNKLELLQGISSNQEQLRREQVLLADTCERLRQKEEQLSFSEREKYCIEERMQQQEEELRRMEIELAEAKDIISRGEQQMRDMKAQIHAKTELLEEKDSELAYTRETIRATSNTGPSTTTKSSENRSNKLAVMCHHKHTAPCEMYRGSATTDGRFAYFMPHNSTTVHKYELTTERWNQLPPCPYRHSGLAVMNGELTAVGGCNENNFTGTLFTLRQGEWVEEYPPMSVPRYRPAVASVSEGEKVIVIGGNSGGWATTVEVLQVNVKTWQRLTDLPRPLPLPSAAVCGDQLVVISRDSISFSCSLQPLLTQVTSESSNSILSWRPLPPLPVAGATAATLCGQLVIIGGSKEYRSPVKSIRQLVNGKWVKIGSMATGRWSCLAVSPVPDKVIIVGGVVRSQPVNVVECVATM